MKPLQRMFDEDNESANQPLRGKRGRDVEARRARMGADDPGGDIDLGHEPRGGTLAGGPGQYRDLMQYMTGGRNAGPSARRAEAGMPGGPRPMMDDVRLQDTTPLVGRLAPLLRLFGGGR